MRWSDLTRTPRLSGWMAFDSANWEWVNFYQSNDYKIVMARAPFTDQGETVIETDSLFLSPESLIKWFEKNGGYLKPETT